MAAPFFAAPASIGLDDESWKSLSSPEVQCLVRGLTVPDNEGRTYSSVSILRPVDGRDLYVMPH